MSYLIFFIIAAVTVFSPGPGVILTLSNALKRGVTGALPGIFGIATATFVVAGVSATGLGILLTSSEIAFSVLKYTGAAYLFYLGIKLWRGRHDPSEFEGTIYRKNARFYGFSYGFMMQLTNPKAVFFFISIFPQFVDPNNNFLLQFAVLVGTYSALVIVIHCFYAALAFKARSWLVSGIGNQCINRCSGAMFMTFGALLANSER